MPSAFLKHPFMSQRAVAECDDDAMVRAMLAFELALAEVQEASGAVPDGISQQMREQLEHAHLSVSEIADGIASGGNVAIPFVKQSRALLANDLKRYWHQGATSQDVVDSALMLLLKPRLAALDELLLRCRSAALKLMDTHIDTPMVGRTLMQQALPITFGVKVAHWAIGLEQSRRRLDEVELPVQFGGAVGAHSGWDTLGLEWMDALAGRLGLAVPVLPWHTDRYPIHALGTALDAVAGAAEKIALDVSLLTQTEVGEVAEPSAPGMGESSSMPHKRNPVRSALIRGAARQVHGHTSVLINATAQPLERGLGEWHAEWAPLMESALLVEGALEQVAVLLEGLEVYPDNMWRNLAATGGGIMAEPVARLLAPTLGVEKAKAVSAEAAETSRREARPYSEVLAEHSDVKGTVDPDALSNACDPALYLGSSAAQVTRAKKWLAAQ
ncbi:MULTISPECIES: class-II fumarase/aspartase family protein [Halomonadaceae]|uniref:class-II fumarase/aspartase family protein n=1 Tax=Halomonadaceae TaxID=28256 RepID=UPI0012F4592B|nr:MULTISPECIES: adenylosuccinate lyase family protein [Halomonas]CAD5248064.1 3-carboxy-cis,cis-muconate cycloisomerase [Halomonas sp. 156]CAD5265524.1 3-carboxy-cis,cis-muconate cycloisomerase [Halomonas sp. 113]CAD5267585.1 3-carboxy-cis,cis-muconate cycloisomerase [Halomonas sp. 59]CAD5280182.1 3-carboxy-cis,cis-muconate cycloisomerase [Halomonas sp. I3]VXB62244.1 3-carboxy-cis,cis-muconate cycloisomerase [Halomonas titanicae]